MNDEENLMEDINLEKCIQVSPNPISIKDIETIFFQMRYYVCKKNTKIGEKGSGFFVKFPYPEKNDLLPVLITNNHVIDNKYIKTYKKIELPINDDSEKREIQIDKDRKAYFSKELDAAIFGIKPNKDNIHNFLSIDEDILKLNFKNKSAYVLHYQKGNNTKVSF
jgi:hypothetical protein